MSFDDFARTINPLHEATDEGEETRLWRAFWNAAVAECVAIIQKDAGLTRKKSAAFDRGLTASFRHTGYVTGFIAEGLERAAKLIAESSVEKP